MDKIKFTETSTAEYPAEAHDRLAFEQLRKVMNAEQDTQLIKAYLYDHSIRHYFCYRAEIAGEVSHYLPNVNALMQFLSVYGQGDQGNIFDLDSSGLVNAPDLLTVLTGTGNELSGTEYIESGDILAQFSSGWIIALEGWEVCFLKPSVQDESGGFIPNVLQSFWLEGTKDGVPTKLFFYCYENVNA